MEDDDDQQKPKRLEEETISYLQTIDNQLSNDNTDQDTLCLLVKNVLDEIRNRAASAACDRHCNAIIEKLIFSASFIQLIEEEKNKK